MIQNLNVTFKLKNKISKTNKKNFKIRIFSFAVDSKMLPNKKSTIIFVKMKIDYDDGKCFVKAIF